MRYALSIVLLAISCTALADVIRLSEPVDETATHEVFGSTMRATAEPVSLADIMAAPESHQGNTLVIQTRVAKVCQKKGCFFIAQQGRHALRVSFKDYGFFVPTDMGGKAVTLVGELVERTLTAEQAAHFNQDAGAADAFASGTVYEIVATAVSVPKG